MRLVKVINYEALKDKPLKRLYECYINPEHVVSVAIDENCEFIQILFSNNFCITTTQDVLDELLKN